MRKIVITGGSGRFGSVIKQIKNKEKIFFPKKNELNILKLQTIKKYLKKIKPKIVIHLAGLSRPMYIHENNINKSIDLNIIGTANVAKVCNDLKIKLVYFSTCYVYPGKKGSYKESEAVYPINNYAWSKLGGESSVQMIKNSLILRVSMTEKPFIHNKAFGNVKSNFIFHESIAKFIFKIINCEGILNVGGEIQSVYNFAKKKNINIKKIRAPKNFPLNPSMNINKLKKILNKKIII
jgi:dTDP-4-dehydrorhamnose reductase